MAFVLLNRVLIETKITMFIDAAYLLPAAGREFHI
jgi:hypothetical protein